MSDNQAGGQLATSTSVELPLSQRATDDVSSAITGVTSDTNKILIGSQKGGGSPTSSTADNSRSFRPASRDVANSTMSSPMDGTRRGLPRRQSGSTALDPEKHSRRVPTAPSIGEAASSEDQQHEREAALLTIGSAVLFPSTRDGTLQRGRLLRKAGTAVTVGRQPSRNLWQRDWDPPPSPQGFSSPAHAKHPGAPPQRHLGEQGSMPSSPTGGQRRNWNGDFKQLRLANSSDALEAFGGQLAALPVSTTNAMVDALRYQWRLGQRYSWLGPMLLRLSGALANDERMALATPSASFPHTALLPSVDFALGVHSTSGMISNAASQEDDGPGLVNLCQKSLRQIALLKRPACIVFRGGSHSERLDAINEVLNHLVFSTRRSMDPSMPEPAPPLSDEQEDLRQQAMRVTHVCSSLTTILEAFCCTSSFNSTKTCQSGILIKLNIGGHACNSIVGASFLQVLLGRSRLGKLESSCGRRRGERSFNIFYQILNGVDEDSAHLKHGLPVVDACAYLTQKVTDQDLGHDIHTTTPTEDQRYCREELLPALARLGIVDKELDQLINALIGVVACGDVLDDDHINPVSMERIATCLGVSSLELMKSMGVMFSRKREFIQVQSVTLAQHKMNTLARSVYSALLDWIFALAGQQCSAGPATNSDSWLGILDFPSSQISRHDGDLEELLGNHASERLRLYFLQALASMPVATYPDYKREVFGHCPALLQLVEGQGPLNKGLLDLLDEESRLHDGSDAGFAAACAKTLAGRYCLFIRGPLGAHARFKVEHSHISAHYSVAGFCERNEDCLLSAAVELLSHSTNSVLRDAFEEKAKATATGTRLQRMIDEGGQVKRQGGHVLDPMQASSSQAFCNRLRYLEETATAGGKSQLEFVHCLQSSLASDSSSVAPSDAALRFEWNLVMNEWHGLGLERAAPLLGFKHKGIGKHDPSPPGIYSQLLFRDRELLGWLMAPLALQKDCWREASKDMTSSARRIIRELGCQVMVDGSSKPSLMHPDAVAKDDYIQLSSAGRSKLEGHRQTAIGKLELLAEILQAAVRASQARNALQAAQKQAEAALPKLQARIRRRMQISDRLAEELQKRSSAATTVQRYLRGMKTRSSFDNRSQEVHSRRELLAILRTCMLRQRLAQFVTSNRAMALQSHWRGGQARKKTRETFFQTESKQQLKAALRCVQMRLRLAFQISSEATVKLQMQSRSLLSKKQLEIRKTEHRDKMLVLAVLRACRLRHRLEDNKIEDSALKLQASLRGMKARAYADRLRQATESAEIMLPVLKAIKLRIDMASVGEMRVTQQLQAVRRNYAAKRKNRALCMQRLQRLLLGLMRRLEARRFVTKLQEQYNSHNRPMIFLGSVFKTLHFRDIIAERQEEIAAIRIQARQRGIAGRARALEAKKAWACFKIRLVMFRYQAQQQLASILEERDHARAVHCYCSALKSVVLRSRFAPHLYYLSACERIARALRAYKARRIVAQVRWEHRSALASACIKWVLKSNQMKELVLILRHESDMRAATSMMLSVVRTLQWRALMDWEIREAKVKKATDLISCYVQGIKVRRGFHSDMINDSSSLSIQESRRILAMKGDLHVVDTVRTHVRRLRFEMEDERKQDMHLAAVRMQRSWRGRQTRLHKLLPRAAERLAAERRDLHELKNAESLSLANIEASPVGQGLKPIFVEVLRARPKPAQGWLAALAHMQEPAVDLDLADSFAVVAGTSGSVYCLPSQAGTKFVGTPNVLDFTGPMILGHRRLLVQMPTVINISCGEHHAIMLSADGLAFAWGLNDSGQCGIGWPHNEASGPPEKVVAQATCIQPWAAASTHNHAAMAHDFGPGPAFSEPQRGLILASGAVPPRLQSISCGPKHSAAVDIEGSLWLWGCKEAFGLTCLAPLKPPRSPPSRGVSFTGQKGAVKMPIHPFLLFQVMEGVPRKEGGVQWCRPNRQEILGPGRSSLLQKADAGDRYISTSEKAVQENADRSRGKRATIHVHHGQDKSVETLALRQIEGNVPCPMLCCDITFLDAGGDALSSAMPDCAVIYSEANRAEAVLSPARGTAGGGYTRTEMTFVGVSAGKKANFATSSRHMVYSWGAQRAEDDDASILGRPLDDHDSAPAPIPAFLRLAINVTIVSLGWEHALALSSHGRVFTWGEMEACTIDQGFTRRLISQPHSVDGALRNVRVTQVSAGRTSNTVTLQDETVLGWEMVEISSVTQPKVLPAIFEYVALATDGPSSGSWISSPTKSVGSSLVSSPQKGVLRTSRRPTSSRASTPTGARSKLQPSREPATARRVVHKYSTALQLLLVDPQPAPARSHDMFVWAQQHSQTAQHMPADKEKARDHQRKALAAAQEREHMRRLTPAQIVKDAVQPRTRFEMDREIARYARLAGPPAEGVSRHQAVGEKFGRVA